MAVAYISFKNETKRKRYRYRCKRTGLQGLDAQCKSKALNCGIQLQRPGELKELNYFEKIPRPWRTCACRIGSIIMLSPRHSPLPAVPAMTKAEKVEAGKEAI